MLRRWISILGLVALVGTVVLVAAQPASASLRDRLGFRRGYGYDTPAYYYETAPATTMTTTTQEPAVMTYPTNSSPRFSGRFMGRRNADTYYVPATTATTTATTNTVTVAPPTSPPPVMTVPQQTTANRGILRRFGSGRRSETVSNAPVLPPATVPAPGGDRTAFYPATAAYAPVSLTVKIPANAELLIDGEKTKSVGSSRQFISPPIANSRDYSYELQAKWLENGKEMKKTKKVAVKAGQEVLVDFLKPVSNEKPIR